jgi:hypothetical protein
MQSSNIVSAIITRNFSREHGENVGVIKYRCDLPPPLFEGHHYFLEPVSRIHCKDHILATFQWTFMMAQKAYYANKLKKPFPFMGNDLLELALVLSNTKGEKSSFLVLNFMPCGSNFY